MPERTCAADGCDQPITDGRSDKRYHADECKWRAQRTRRREARYREKVAARARRKAASAHTCIICDHQFQAINPDARHCSESCVGFSNALKRTKGQLWSAIWWRQCLECGSWVSRHDTTYYCTDPCRTRARQRRNRRLGARRRARLRRAWVGEDFDSHEIFERDSWTCQLCHRRVRRNATVPHPLAPVLDHVIPLARGPEAGGLHTRANTQCAHFLCNSLKQDGVHGDGEQLRLIG